MNPTALLPPTPAQLPVSPLCEHSLRGEGGAPSPSNWPRAGQCPCRAFLGERWELRTQALSPLDPVYFAAGRRGLGSNSRAPLTPVPTATWTRPNNIVKEQ